ncbi:MAG TPA: hypothetical protein VMV49_12990 [Candidatus Deferrimicrobium sp.]|nr:hypothetical protein [Candidatus Deferrimicrobium sp.]
MKDFKNWGNVYSVNDFIEVVKKSLGANNFNKDNSRLVFSVCSDDVNRLEGIETVENALTKEYNREFHLGGLGAYPIGGVSGIIAASHHPPDNLKKGDRNQGNLIFFISPHMGLIEKEGDFIFGKIIRPGQERITAACGVMMEFLVQLVKSGNLKNLKVLSDDLDIEPTRTILYQELINKYSNELNEILMYKDKNQQIIELFKLNYTAVKNKLDQMIEAFLKKETDHFQGNIAVVGGITLNTREDYYLFPGKDYFILKEISFPIC